MLTFKFCHQLVGKGRLNPHVGKRFRSTTWVRYDELYNRFVISNAWPGYTRIPNSNLYDKDWSAAHIDDWAYVYEDRTEIISCPGHNDLLYAFGVAYRPAPTNSVIATEWMYNGQIVIGRLPVVIRDGKLTAKGWPLQRHVDKKKLKEYNAIVKNVMNIVTTRVKLGVWDHSDFKTESFHAKYPRIDIHDFWRIVCTVKDSDLESVEQFIELVHNVSEARNYEPFGSQASIRFAKNFFARFKDLFLSELGALEYR